jgi:hypothetical protein
VWTLQEAYLSPHAYLVSREAAFPLIQSIDSKHPVKAQLEHLCCFSDILHKVCQRKQRIGKIYWEKVRTSDKMTKRLKYLDEVSRMLAHRGLVALASRNPIALFGAATYRKTTHDNDKVYGIQQVFGLRLDSPVSGSGNYGILAPALENHLGAKILKRYPVLSQMHVYTQPVEAGRGWRVSAASSILDLDLRTSLADITFRHACKLSTVSSRRIQWGSFQGRICDFGHLQQAWSIGSEMRPDGSKSLQQICLDALHRPKGRPLEYRHVPIERLKREGFEPRYPTVWEFSRGISRGREQHELASWVITQYSQAFPNKRLVVLLLGEFYDTPKEGEVKMSEVELYKVGLILVESEFNDLSYWKRLGFCIWACGHASATAVLPATVASVLGAQDKHAWQEASGMFG